MTEYQVIDADGHFDEPTDLWPEYLEKRFHSVAPRFVFDNCGRPRILIGGELKGYIPMPPGHTPGDTMAGGRDPHARLADMKKEGIDVMVMYPTMGLFFYGIPQLDLTVALCRAFNDWAGDFCAVEPERLFAPAILPQMDIQESMNEARRVAEKRPMQGVVLRPNPVAGRTLDHPAFEPMWSLLEELDVPLVLHEGTTQDVPQAGTARYDNFMFRHIITHAFEQQMGLMSLICGGVLERHPGLRVLIVEAGIGWVPYWLDRLDHHVEKWGFASAPLEEKPSTYFARQCFVSADAEEFMLPQVVSLIGDDNLCFSTDYPHPDHTFEGVVAALAERTDLSDASKRKILGGNAARVFKI
jgi:predicted TIM-barrel fold metal-dependent hydrolase